VVADCAVAEALFRRNTAVAAAFGGELLANIAEIGGADRALLVSQGLDSRASASAPVACR